MAASIIRLDAKFVRLAQDYLEGLTLEQLADKYELEVPQVSEFLARKEVKTYIAQRIQQFGYNNPLSRMNLINRIIDQKIEMAEENDMPLSKKDLVEVLKLAQDEAKLLHKDLDESPQVQINIQTQYQDLMEDLLGNTAE